MRRGFCLRLKSDPSGLNVDKHREERAGSPSRRARVSYAQHGCYA